MIRIHDKITVVEEDIARDRRLIAAHGDGSKDPWPKDKIDKVVHHLDVLKEIRDDYKSRADLRGGV